MSETKDQQYFADGLTEELIQRLASMPRLHVVARSSSFYFKGNQATVTEMARTLGVSYLLEGSVRKAGDGIRITTHIVRGDDGYDLWSETYERPLADIFRIQDEIASAVAQVLKVSVVPEEPNLTSNPEAYTEFLRAMAHVDRGSASDYQAADTQLHAALRLDPQFAGAWALLAVATIWRFDVRAPNPTPEACASARSAANRALELGPTLSQSHRAKGIALQSCEGDLDGARAEFDRALQLQPDDPLLLMSQARLAAEMGRPDRSLEFARRATAIDPLNPWAFSALGDINLYFGHPGEAENAYRKAIQINPSLAYNHSALAVALLTDHEPAEAVAESGREPDPQYSLKVRTIALDAAGRNKDAEQELAELELRYGEENADWVALFYACRHDSNDAIQWLHTYLARHKRLLEYQPYLMSCFNNLAEDPRYQEIRHQMRSLEEAPSGR
jgi:TolB-like protein/Flp pilus assembly protein TadD